MVRSGLMILMENLSRDPECDGSDPQEGVSPILYSFRRCPYAIRARMAIAYAGLKVELREVLLAKKPPSMIVASPKGTVPVLVLDGGRVLDESYDVMRWALEFADPDSWWFEGRADETLQLIEENDFQFKTHLDHYKYADRFPDHPMTHYRGKGEAFLSRLESLLQQHSYLLADQLTFADVAIFPFIRQFAHVDKAWFDQAPYPYLRKWLQSLLESKLFLGAMHKFPRWEEDDKPVWFPNPVS